MPPSAQLEKSCINPRHEKGQYRGREGGVGKGKAASLIKLIGALIKKNRRLNED